MEEIRDRFRPKDDINEMNSGKKRGTYFFLRWGRIGRDRFWSKEEDYAGILGQMTWVFTNEVEAAFYR